MIDLHVLLAFIAAVTVLMLIPGPNVALIVANSVAYGPRYGLLTVAGTATAMVLQLMLTALGMAKILAASGVWFEWLRWVGRLISPRPCWHSWATLSRKTGKDTACSPRVPPIVPTSSRGTVILCLDWSMVPSSTCTGSGVSARSARTQGLP